MGAKGAAEEGEWESVCVSECTSANKILSIVKSAREGEKKRFNLHNTLLLK